MAATFVETHKVERIALDKMARTYRDAGEELPAEVVARRKYLAAERTREYVESARLRGVENSYTKATTRAEEKAPKMIPVSEAVAEAALAFAGAFSS